MQDDSNDLINAFFCIFFLTKIQYENIEFVILKSLSLTLYSFKTSKNYRKKKSKYSRLFSSNVSSLSCRMTVGGVIETSMQVPKKKRGFLVVAPAN